MEKIRHNAHIVSRIPDEIGIMTVQDLKVYTTISEKELYMAVGWLACDRRIFLLADENDAWRIVLLN